MTIPVLKVDLESQSGIWTPALAGHLGSARRLLGAFNREAERFGGRTLLAALKFGANLLNELMGRHFRGEIKELASLSNASLSEVLLANLAYDLANSSGCSTFVQSLSSRGTLHARNLDWEFPRGLLKKHLIVAQVRNGKRPYSIVTWPGLFGVLTGVAKGRFAITINYVRHREESNGMSLAIRALQGYWPVTWLVRKIFDEAKDYKAAFKSLCDEPILAPVLFAISGPNATEGAIIEREAVGGEVRQLSQGSVCVTNHFVSERLAQVDAGNDMLFSNKRLAFLERKLRDNAMRNADDALRLLSRRPLLQERETQYQVAMSAREGSLEVRIPGAPTVRVDNAD